MQVASTGQRYAGVRAGFSVTYPAMPDGRMTDYGFNAMAIGLREYKVPRVLVMDYRRPLIDFDGFPSPVNDDDPADFVPDDRHKTAIADAP